jgi:3-oxoadipate enol-lactonase
MSGVVVLSGSLGSTHAMWDAQLPALRDFELVRVDHPGHGGEPAAPVRDVRDLARLVLERVDAPRFSFVGLSLGGAIGMRLALDVPERLERLVLACTSARFGEPQGWLERASLVRAEGLEAIVDTILGRWFSPSFPDVRRYREMFLSVDRESYASCCEAIAGWDVREQLPSVTTPTFCLAGSDDPSAPPEEVELIATRIPCARLEVIRGGRHLVNVEQRDEFNRLLVEYLD